MKKIALVATSLGFVLFVGVGMRFDWFGTSKAERFPKLPSQPNFTVSLDYDGDWLGRRVDVTGNNLCERTTITGSVEQGFVQLILTYNGTPLRGWIDTQGNIKLYANHSQWDYRFSGTVSGNVMQGSWYLTNGPCKGTWRVQRQ
ncbi:hypothetical protein [Vibrio panuliri]|uniref:Uncharacterized protein n=1 Tax=Vibrio panuliri TaxID=1381081 RepID=A0A1Q9HQ53_9VIBR|nr:hypothetical protein [Vibrio panuliri]KAB1457837.1 hypothetical protein F7O85_08905 [Vibrio panuliri]OLQ91063.1 hypothetical protein BIY20_09970 [Vibrio panuliri]OLQ92962.1 hypothetical protein BIY22_00245 [Vibrio panuliri]